MIMTLHWPDLNLLAVIVAGLVAFFLGALWYTALFGKLWIKLNEYTPGQLMEMKKARPPVVFFGGMLLAYWLMATMMGFLCVWTKADTWLDGVCVGLVVWGIVQAVAITTYISSLKRKEVFMLDGAYQLCYLVLAGIILAVWK
jgi:Protein of unknown function (DUF1761)